MRLVDFLTRAADRDPEHLAAVFPDTSITYGALDRRSNAVAAHLASIGVAPGDRVSLLWGNALEGFVAFWGVLKLGAVNVDLPGLAQRGTIETILEEAKPKALVAEPALLEKIEGGTPLGHKPAVVSNILELGESEVRPANPREPDDVALVVYTSGTTGRPKGVMLSHENFASNLTAANDWMHLDANDSILVVVPSYFVHGRMQILMHAMIGGTLVFSAGFHFPKKVVQEIVDHRVTGFSGVPYHFKSLMKSFAAAETPDLKYVLCTGGALSLTEQDKLREALGEGVGIHTAYGQTEAAPRITYASPEDLFGRRGTAGRPLSNVLVEILGDDDEVLPLGEVGEVVASGPNIMKGYVSGDEVTSGRLDAKGRLRTGDLGRLDDGHLFLVGRKSDMMKLAGERVFPQEIEDVLNRHDAIVESAVFAVPDDRMGERLIACVVLEAGQSLTMAELRPHCLEHMSFVRVPRELHVVAELPKTGSGKINRGKIPSLVPST
ncbi:MAG: class I adenylate-forming enzyme family protein [Deltaproteobacteria bacterium]